MSVDPAASDIRTAVAVPFRMQPGLVRLPPDARHFTPLASGSKHQREKLAVLSAFWPQALLRVPDFDAAPALATAYARAAAEHPHAWKVGADGVAAPALGVSVDGRGHAVQHGAGAFGCGDEVWRCVAALPPQWRAVGLFALTFAEDLAVLDARDTRVPWLAVALPSHWAPEDKVGKRFAEIHAPVADNARLVAAAEALARVVSSVDAAWERWVWTVTDQPRLHAHPARSDPDRWRDTPVDRAWWRSERQTFVPVAGRAQALFTIRVDVRPLAAAVADPRDAALVHAAIASMSDAVLAYRGLAAVRAPLLVWLAERAI